MFNLKSASKFSLITFLFCRLDVEAITISDFIENSILGQSQLKSMEWKEEAQRGFQSNRPQIKISPSPGNLPVTRLKCSPHWLQTQVQCSQTLGPVLSGLICDVKQEGVLSFSPLWALVRTINTSPQQEGVRSILFSSQPREEKKSDN